MSAPSWWVSNQIPLSHFSFQNNSCYWQHLKAQKFKIIKSTRNNIHSPQQTLTFILCVRIINYEHTRKMRLRLTSAANFFFVTQFSLFLIMIFLEKRETFDVKIYTVICSHLMLVPSPPPTLSLFFLAQFSLCLIQNMNWIFSKVETLDANQFHLFDLALPPSLSLNFSLCFSIVARRNFHDFSHTLSSCVHP